MDGKCAGLPSGRSHHRRQCARIRTGHIRRSGQCRAPSTASTVRSTDGGSLSNNLIGFVENDGAVLADVSGWAISGNEVREAAQVASGSDGINDGAGSTGNTISGNLIVDSGGFGLDGTTTGDTITNNTITGSGVLGVQTAGIRRTAGPNTISSTS